jgi:hypothetical protein
VCHVAKVVDMAVGGASLVSVDLAGCAMTCSARAGHLKPPSPGRRASTSLTIDETFRALTGDRGLAAKLLTVPALPAGVHRDARMWLAAEPVA